MLFGFIVLLLIVTQFSVDHFFNDLSDRAEYIQHFYALHETGYIADNTIRISLFLSYLYYYLAEAFGVINYSLFSIILMFFSVTTLSLFFLQLYKSINFDSHKATQWVIIFCLCFFYNPFVLYLFKGLYAELYFLPLLFFGLYLLYKEKYLMGSLLFLGALLTKIEMLVLFPLRLFWYILFIYEQNKNNTIILIGQNILFLLGVYTLFIEWKLSYFNTYYNIDANRLLFGLMSIGICISQYILYKTRMYIRLRINITIIKNILIGFGLIFILVRPLYYWYSGGTFDTLFIADNLATATDLDLINIVRIGILVGIIPLVGLIYYVKNVILSSFHEKKINTILAFFYVLFFIVSLFLFYESFHEPNILVRSRRFIGIIIPGLTFILVFFLKNNNQFITMILVTGGIISSILFNTQNEYLGYTKGIQEISDVIVKQCDNQVIVYDIDVYTHEAVYTSLFMNHEVYRYTQGISTKNNTNCLLLPKRKIKENPQIIKGKNEIKMFAISFDKFERSLFKLPKEKIEVTYEMVLYK